ncbi:hypothetical protein TKK_0015923 [Trichogramma kaykai]
MRLVVTGNFATDESIATSEAPSSPLCSSCWIAVDAVVITVIILGNVLTILAVRLSRRLRNPQSNRLILSLAVSDLLVGLAVIYHLLFFLDARLACYKYSCIPRFVFPAFCCCASFCNVTAIAFDRYLAIIHPLKYSEYARERLFTVAITIIWACSAFVSTIPIYWNIYDSSNVCELYTVFPRLYMIAILTPLFVTVWLSIFVLYLRIWREARIHARRWKLTGANDLDRDSSQKKSIQVVLPILGCFTIFWLPYVVVALVHVIDVDQQPSPTIYRVMFSMAMLNSAVNPIIYAWKNRAFRKAFKKLMRCRSPDYNQFNSSFQHYLRKQDELVQRDVKNGPERLLKDAVKNHKTAIEHDSMLSTENL